MSQKLTPEDIERRKDYLDLVPCIEFVDKHRQIFDEGLCRFLDKFPSDISQFPWLEKIKIEGVEDIVEPQLNPKHIMHILVSLPESLRMLSMLETVTYHLFGNKRVIPVPGYDRFGNFVSKKVQLVSVDEFPRPGDHPTRLLVGNSNGKEIRLTPIPKCVSIESEAVWYYQVHVFLHEFFHSIEYLCRDPKERSKILLKADVATFTFQYWWEKFEELILSRREPRAVSRYAATYRRQLTPSYKKKSLKQFTHALAEQICETFVAYMLNIIANDDGWTNFREESFGNKKQAELFQLGQAPAANEKWLLMDQLCRAKVLTS